MYVSMMWRATGIAGRPYPERAHGVAHVLARAPLGGSDHHLLARAPGAGAAAGAARLVAVLLGHRLVHRNGPPLQLDALQGLGCGEAVGEESKGDEAVGQGPSFVHFSAQCQHLTWDTLGGSSGSDTKNVSS